VLVYYTIKPSSAYPYTGLLFVGTVPGKFDVFTLFFVFLLAMDLKADRVYIVHNKYVLITKHIIVLHYYGVQVPTVEVTGTTGIVIT